MRAAPGSVWAVCTHVTAVRSQTEGVVLYHGCCSSSLLRRPLSTVRLCVCVVKIHRLTSSHCSHHSELTAANTTCWVRRPVQHSNATSSYSLSRCVKQELLTDNTHAHKHTPMHKLTYTIRYFSISLIKVTWQKTLLWPHGLMTVFVSAHSQATGTISQSNSPPAQQTSVKCQVLIIFNLLPNDGVSVELPAPPRLWLLHAVCVIKAAAAPNAHNNRCWFTQCVVYPTGMCSRGGVKLKWQCAYTVCECGLI